ncbi:hypothetical protein LHJ74_25040 [Streptomyces sp. N2-109]|uniref:Uncharacterized protein n=1 Tax=Streptomyces gossypii TaxID=2883101 RepID=A0ABT2JZ18_9ACTN|nr:hypothetical protein [Streptomyces gossypii]MCT2593135.1 hypothetical protein [Streptomyces gossypii]
MVQRTSDRNAGVTIEFERDVFKLLLETKRTVAKQERALRGTGTAANQPEWFRQLPQARRPAIFGYLRARRPCPGTGRGLPAAHGPLLAGRTALRQDIRHG